MTPLFPTEADHAACRDLVDFRLIEEAKRTHRDAAAKAADAERELALATGRALAADQAADAAAAGQGGHSPLDAEAALEAAQREVRAATRVRDAAAQARDAAAQAIETAGAAAHKPLSDAGLKLRAVAIVRWERARAAVDEAQRHYDMSGLMLNTAKANGCLSYFSGDSDHFAGMPVRPLKDEAPHWMDRRSADWLAAVEEATK
jgi:hypothetical protein